MYRQCMTANVHLMLPPFVPDVTIHVDSLEIYMLIRPIARGDATKIPPPPLPGVRCFTSASSEIIYILSLASSSYGTYKNALGPKVSLFSYLAR